MALATLANVLSKDGPRLSKSDLQKVSTSFTKGISLNPKH